jgi:glycosyltransferase involved in cell wall biosynthesis
MKILVSTFSFPSLNIKHFGGSFVAGEAIAYAKNGAQVTVLTPYIKGAVNREYIYENVEVIRFQYFWPRNLQTLLQPNQPIYSQKSIFSLIKIPFLCLFFTLKILRHASKVDLIHAQWTLSALLALPAKWIFGKKIVLTARGSDISLLPLWLNRFIHRSVDGAVDCFGPQQWNIEYKKKFEANYIRLPLIVHDRYSVIIPEDLQLIRRKGPNLFIILYIGRFDSQKIKDHKLPLFDLIHASSIIKYNQTNFHVIYLGDGEMIGDLISLVDKYNLSEFISILGPRNNVFDYIRYCHLGIGGIAFNGVSEEYTVCAKPQLMVEGGANSSTPWIDNKNVLYFKGGDCKNLGSKIFWAMENRERLNEIGQNAKNDMAQFITDSQTGGQLYLEKFCKL